MFGSNNKRNLQAEQDLSNQSLNLQQLQLQLLQMTSNYYNAQKDANYHSGEFQKLKSAVEAMCKSLISNNYNTSQLGGNSILKNMSVFDLIEFAKNDFSTQKKQYMETIRTLKEQNDFYLQRTKELQESLNNALLSTAGIPDAQPTNDFIDNTPEKKIVINRTEETIPNSKQTYQENIPVPKQYNPIQNNNNHPQQTQHSSIPVTPVTPVVPSTQNRPPQPKPPMQSTSPTLVINSVEAIINTLSAPDWLVIEAIGSQGFSESSDILTWIYQEYPEYNGKRSVLLQSLSNLNKSQVLESQDTSTGIRRTLKVYRLSNAGVQIYKTKYNDNPVEAECDKIARDHDNIKHGYTIKDTFNQFKTNFPIKDIDMDRSRVSIKLPNGETYIPDIVVTLNDKEKTTYYVEVELGNTEATQEKDASDFNKKCDKMFQVTKTFVIISDTAEVKKKNDQKISTWMVKRGGKDKLTGLTVYSATVTDLSKGDMGKPYIKL